MTLEQFIEKFNNQEDEKLERKPNIFTEYHLLKFFEYLIEDEQLEGNAEDLLNEYIEYTEADYEDNE